MPLRAASTRYSLVKGERIVRSVLTARLRAFSIPSSAACILECLSGFGLFCSLTVVSSLPHLRWSSCSLSLLDLLVFYYYIIEDELEYWKSRARMLAMLYLETANVNHFKYIALLSKFNVKDSQNGHGRMDEILNPLFLLILCQAVKLLKASLQSKIVLSDVFLARRGNVSHHIPSFSIFLCRRC
ncbi:Mitochondrial chaperone BCS1 [Corchorus olitorius]|uniref:Mitochondrial chaperone BCS1 n=1 Tax=Corchorus olitorius TaxID=93759 RepID=A0A1R3K6I1_9ROSI|nr:Mitochondrial chaperone BCS1 [Corchorus olitorius]